MSNRHSIANWQYLAAVAFSNVCAPEGAEETPLPSWFVNYANEHRRYCAACADRLRWKTMSPEEESLFCPDPPTAVQEPLAPPCSFDLSGYLVPSRARLAYPAAGDGPRLLFPHWLFVISDEGPHTPWETRTSRVTLLSKDLTMALPPSNLQAIHKDFLGGTPVALELWNSERVLTCNLNWERATRVPEMAESMNRAQAAYDLGAPQGRFFLTSGADRRWAKAERGFLLALRSSLEAVEEEDLFLQEREDLEADWEFSGETLPGIFHQNFFKELGITLPFPLTEIGDSRPLPAPEYVRLPFGSTLEARAEDRTGMTTVHRLVLSAGQVEIEVQLDLPEMRSGRVLLVLPRPTGINIEADWHLAEGQVIPMNFTPLRDEEGHLLPGHFIAPLPDLAIAPDGSIQGYPRFHGLNTA